MSKKETTFFFNLDRNRGPIGPIHSGPPAKILDYSFAEWQKKAKELQSTTCEGKVVGIEGKKYKLTEI